MLWYTLLSMANIEALYGQESFSQESLGTLGQAALGVAALPPEEVAYLG